MRVVGFIERLPPYYVLKEPAAAIRPLRLARSGRSWPQFGRRLFGDCSPLPLAAWQRWHAVGIAPGRVSDPVGGAAELTRDFRGQRPDLQRCRARQIPDGGIDVSQITLDRCDSARDRSPRMRPGSGRDCRDGALHPASSRDHDTRPERRHLPDLERKDSRKVRLQQWQARLHAF